MPLNIEKELAQMRRMTVDDLREKFTEVFGQPTQSRHKAWLIKRLAWRMQANDEGGLSQRARQRAAELADETNIRILMPRVAKQATLPAADVVAHRTEVQSPSSGNPLAVHGVPMREDLPGRFPIPERVWGNTEILCCVSDFHEVAKLVHDGLQSKKIALDGQTLPKVHQFANERTQEHSFARRGRVKFARRGRVK